MNDTPVLEEAQLDEEQAITWDLEGAGVLEAIYLSELQEE